LEAARLSPFTFVTKLLVHQRQKSIVGRPLYVMELEECFRLISTTVGTFVPITSDQHPSKHVERVPCQSGSGRELLGDRIFVALLVFSS